MAKGEYASGERKKRINYILQACKELKERNDGLNKKKLISIQSIEWGITPAKMREYIRLLLDCGHIYEKDDILYYNG